MGELAGLTTEIWPLWLRPRTTDGINQTLGELAAGRRCLPLYIKAELWESAVVQAENYLILMADCPISYGNRSYGVGPGISANTAIARY